MIVCQSVTIFCLMAENNISKKQTKPNSDNNSCFWGEMVKKWWENPYLRRFLRQFGLSANATQRIFSIWLLEAVLSSIYDLTKTACWLKFVLFVFIRPPISRLFSADFTHNSHKRRGGNVLKFYMRTLLWGNNVDLSF